MNKLRYSRVRWYDVAIRNLYFEAFPKEERYPYWALLRCAQSKNVDYLGISREGALIGLTYLVHYKNIIYVFYLAVRNSERNRGYGSQILQDIIAKNPDKKILLCIEFPNNTLRERRRNFYLRNGMHSTQRILDNQGYKYEFLCSDEFFAPNAKTISEIYKTLAWPPLAGRSIRKSLEVDNIRLSDAK